MSLDINIKKFTIKHLLLEIYLVQYAIFLIKCYNDQHLKRIYGYSLKICSFIKEKKVILKRKFSTVATYANELDSVEAKETTNFEYDDHEWDVKIGNLIIDLDADIEKTRNEKLIFGHGMASTPSLLTSKKIQNVETLTYTFHENVSHSDNINLSSIVSTSSSIVPAVSCNAITHSYNLVNIVSTASNSSKVTTITNRTNTNADIPETNIRNKMTVEHLASADKGLKMKIKRTKSGTKFSEAKHEIVKSNEVENSTLIQDGHSIANSTVLDSSLIVVTSSCTNNTTDIQSFQSQHKMKSSQLISTGSNAATVNTIKKNVCNRREKSRDKYEKSQNIASDLIGSANQITLSHSPSKTISEPFGLSTMTSATTSLHPISSPSVNNCQSTQNALDSYSSDMTGSSSLTNVTNVDVQSNTAITTNLCSQKINESPFSLNSAIFSSCQNKADVFNSSPCQSARSNFNEKTDFISDSPPAKKMKFVGKFSKETSDVCVGTSIGINTEPDCLGPCEPGTSVTLEGIVWHETNGGILVVNITWRGKTYVGTLLDCTRHDWAPPRFCDSPTSDIDIRTSKGRVKRGRTSSNTVLCNDSLNFTGTRNSMHSKLRNNGSKTRRGIHESMAISTCSAPFISPRSDFTLKRKTRCIDEDKKNKRKVTDTLLNVSPSTSPVLLECPEPKCYKKYKHINGLKYHQSHAHGLMEDDDTKEGATSTSENDESIIDIPSPTTPMKSPTGSTESDSKKLKNASASSSEHVLDESSLTLQLTFPTVHVKSTKLMDTNILDKKDTKLKNKECSDNNVTAIISQSFPTKPRCKSEISDPNITKHSCTISLSLEESSPSNSDLLQQYELSTSTIFSKKLQNDKKNNVLQTEQVLPVHQLICQDAISVELSSQLEQDLVKEDEDEVKLIFSENKSSQSKDERFNRIEEAVLSHSNDLFKELPEQTLRQAKDINELSNTFSANSAQTKSVQTNLQSFADISINTKNSQFKVKPTADLMPEDDKNKDSRIPKNIMFKKKTHKSPINSPQRLNAGTQNINADREDLQSPAYSDISDDTITSEAVNTCEKLVKEHETDVKSSAQNNLIPHFSMYPYFSSSSYLAKSSPEKAIEELKINEAVNKSNSKLFNSMPYSPLVNMQNCDLNKEKKDCSSALLSSQLQSHYYANYNNYLSAGYSFQNQDSNCQTLNSFSDSEFINEKSKIKQESELQILKNKHLENHQIIKESIEIKSQTNPYQLFSNSHSQRPSSTVSIGSDDRRFYIYTGDQRRKEEFQAQISTPKVLPLSPKEHSRQEKRPEINKSDENKIRTEGVKPTMETHGPPPPPTSQYAYIHPGYITSHHYGGISFDSEHHGIYRNLTPMLMASTYTSNPYLHQLTRYAPEDLSRPPNGKAIDILHNSNQYYPLHKIHELQERAVKSPITKSQTPSTNTLLTEQSMSIKSPNDLSNSDSLGSTTAPHPPSFNIKQQSQNDSHHQQQQTSTKDSNINSLNRGSDRSPPLQRHVHTHHHTHVGLGYPILTGQYPATYGAATKFENQ